MPSASSLSGPRNARRMGGGGKLGRHSGEAYVVFALP